MSIRPDLQVPVATAQAIVDGVLAGYTVAAVCNLTGRNAPEAAKKVVDKGR
jgi:hypothetical protein